MVKGIGILLMVIIAIMVIPVAIGLVGGIFGIVIGIIGGVFGVVFGAVGSIFGAFFGFIGWIFEGLFGWDVDYWNFGFGDCNFFTLAVVAIVAALLIKSKNQQKTKTP